MCSVMVDGIDCIAAQSIYQNFILVEFQYDVRQPPVLFASQGITITAGIRDRGLCWCVGYFDAWRKSDAPCFTDSNKKDTGFRFRLL